MPETPKHRLRATVTYTVEYTPDEINLDAALQAQRDGLREIANMEQAALRRGDLNVYDLPTRGITRTVKVEVVR